jgi:hypothetical protein
MTVCAVVVRFIAPVVKAIAAPTMTWMVKVSGPVTRLLIPATKSISRIEPRWKNPGGKVIKPLDASVAVAAVSIDWAVVKVLYNVPATGIVAIICPQD